MYISSFSISGYRSLMDVKIKNMKSVCILHGLNNTGKSNVLSALATIFERKVQSQQTETTDELKTHERKVNFYQGRIDNFRDNFYQGGKADITFSVSITFEDRELSFLREVLGKLAKYLEEATRDKVLFVNGRIQYLDEDTAEMILDKVYFNNESHVVFETGPGESKSFFPKLATMELAQRVKHFDILMNLLADSFALVPSDRYLTAESVSEDSIEPISLTPKTFKNYLFNLSLTRTTHKLFEEIKGMFAAKPFECGEISFSKERGEIEIMVQHRKTRLPITRIGSGHQQMLYIIASVVLNRGKMLGIEELEINLSPAAQREVFQKLKEFVHQGSGLVTQLIITSHSDEFEARGDVRCYGVKHDGSKTSVAPWSQSVRRSFFARPVASRR
jgi:AAA ATPase domain